MSKKNPLETRIGGLWFSRTAQGNMLVGGNVRVQDLRDGIMKILDASTSPAEEISVTVWLNVANVETLPPEQRLNPATGKPSPDASLVIAPGYEKKEQSPATRLGNRPPAVLRELKADDIPF
jgi:hypothetical protein